MPFSTCLRLQGDTTAHAHKSGVIFHIFPRAFKQKKKIKALWPKMTKIASRGWGPMTILKLTRVPSFWLAEQLPRHRSLPFPGQARLAAFLLHCPPCIELRSRSADGWPSPCLLELRSAAVCSPCPGQQSWRGCVVLCGEGCSSRTAWSGWVWNPKK